jgi:tetratricopeptide (TPR) repeat protein
MNRIHRRPSTNRSANAQGTCGTPEGPPHGPADDDQAAGATWACELPAVGTALVLVVLVVVAFSPGLRNEFVVWDDPQNFLENPDYRGLGWAQLRWDWTSFHVGVYQPLAWMILGVQYLLFGLKPWGYHLSSVILHAINTAVLFLLTVSILVRSGLGGAPGRLGIVTVSAGLAAALFAVHPLRTEVVAWASCQPYLPCALFLMLSVLAYLHALPAGSAPRAGWLVASFFLFAAALLSKAVAVTLPIVLLILDVYPLHRLGAGRGRWFSTAVRRVWWEKIPFALLSLIFAILAALGRVREERLASAETWGIPERVAQACYGVWFYLIKTVVPANITAYYVLPPRPEMFTLPFVLSVLGVLGVCVGLFLVRRRPAGAALGAVWSSYLVILAPNLGLVRIGSQIAANRYSYVAMMGGAALLAGGLCCVWQAWKTSRLATTSLTMASLGVLIGLILLTQWQCGIWRTTETLWNHVLSHGGSSSDVAHNNLGADLYNQGRLDEARAQIDEALKINPRSVDALCNLGAVLEDQGRLDEARARIDEALRINPRSVDALCHLGAILKEQGRFDEARARFEEALRINPHSAHALCKLGLLLVDQGRFDEAWDFLTTALQVKPDHPDTLYALGFILFRRGRLDEARTRFDAALRLKPDHTGARNSLGSLLARQGRVEQALAQFEKARQINPRNALADNELAFIWAASTEAKYRDGRRAVEAATRACALTQWKNPVFLDTCAAAHAEAGDFDSAVRWQTRAIDLLTDENQKADFRSRLKLYEARKPYHEPIVARSSPG